MQQIVQRQEDVPSFIPPTTSGSSLVERAQAWANMDPNPTTADYVLQLVAATTANNSSTMTSNTASVTDHHHVSNSSINDNNNNISNSNSGDDVSNSQDGTNTSSAILSDRDVAMQELQELFPPPASGLVVVGDDRISFGTAGLRAAMKPGPLGMNDLVVVQTAQGLVRYCNHCHENAQTTTTTTTTTAAKSKPRVIIGYDHRANVQYNVSSRSFALFTTLVFQYAGWDAWLLDGYVPTPLVAYGVTAHADIVLGIMVTASHNPKHDAGYKVYWNDGCQIRSPLDQEITAAILKELQPWTDYRQVYMDLATKHSHDPCLGLSRPLQTEQLKDAYCAALASSGLVVPATKLLPSSPLDPTQPDSAHGPKFCYTAMHGIGYSMASRVFTQVFRLGSLHSVPKQQEPDPNFPTVPFPNPEEDGALDLAMEYARFHQCDIILANDPDADRLAVAEYQHDTKEWIIFTGDQIGCLLGHWLWQNLGQQPSHDNDDNHNDGEGDQSRPVVVVDVMCASAVSSKLLAEIARVEGFHYEETLTGFKWIGARTAQLHRSGQYRALFCYEEALGFCCGHVIFDKDGMSAMGVMGQLVTHVYQCRQMNLQQHLQSLYDKYGEFVSNNGYYYLSDVSMVPVIMDHMTKQGAYDELRSVGPFGVKRVRYLGEPGYDSETADHRPTLPTSKSSPMITFWLDNGCVAQFRASGTEPKFKYYLELQGRPGTPRSQVQQDLLAMTPILLEELLRPAQHGLIHK